MEAVNNIRTTSLVVASLAVLLAGCGADLGAPSGTETGRSVRGLDSRAVLQGCGENCELVRAGIGWVVNEAGVDLGNVVLDTEYRLAGAVRDNDTTSSLLERMASRSEMMIASRESILDCDDGRLFLTPAEPRCRLREGTIFITIGPIEVNGDIASAQVHYVEESESLSGVVSRSYILRLERSGTQWVVTNARLFGMS